MVVHRPSSLFLTLERRVRTVFEARGSAGQDLVLVFESYSRSPSASLRADSIARAVAFARP